MNFYELPLKRNGLPPQWSRQMIRLYDRKRKTGGGRSGSDQIKWGRDGRHSMFCDFRPDEDCFTVRKDGEWLASFSVYGGNINNVTRSQDLKPCP